MDKGPAFPVYHLRHVLALLGQSRNLHLWHIAEDLIFIIVELRNGPISRPVALFLLRLVGRSRDRLRGSLRRGALCGKFKHAHVKMRVSIVED